MKKSKLIFSLLIAMIILVAMSVKSSAVTLSTSETPSTVNSGSEFSIVLKFDEKITAVNAHILYDKELVTMSADNSQGIAIKPEYSEGDLALIYSTFSATDNVFKITAKAADVTEEKVAEFKVTDLQLATETSAAESLDSQTFKVTIKPTTSTGITVNTTDVKLNIGESTTITASGTGSLTWKSSDESITKVDQNGKITALKAGTATITVTDEAGNTKTIKVTVSSTASSVDSSVTNKGKLAKTGESSILLLIIGAIAIIAIVTGIKTKKTKLFVMLPLLVAVTIAGKTAEAKTVGVASDKTTTGILSVMPDLNGIKAIGVSANDTFLAYDKNEQNDKLLLSDLTKFFTEIYKDMLAESPIVISEDGKLKSSDDKLATGDTIKRGNTEYKLVIFGDADGDGEICKSGDINIIICDYLDNAEENNVKKAEGITKVAANIFVEKETENRYRLNVFDINRMKLKYLADENGDPIIGDTLINDESIFNDDEEDDSAPVITPSGNITLDVEETKKLTADKDVTWSSSDPTIVTVDEDGNIKGIKEGTATITATDKTTGKTTTVTVTVGNGILALSKDNGSTWTNYTTLAEAVSAAGTDASVIKVLENTELSFKKSESSDGTIGVLIGENQNITLDLNGKEITNTDNNPMFVDGQFTIKDSVGNGSLTSTNANQQSLINSYSSDKNSKIIIESGNLVKSTDEDPTMQCRVISAKNLEINGGTITSTGGTNIGVTGTNIVINGGTITAKHTAVSCGGDLEINGGTITSTGYYSNGYKNVVVSSTSSTNGNSNIKITGGNITSPSGYDYAVSMDGFSGDISILGGNISGGDASNAAIYQKVHEGNICVYGGNIFGSHSAITQEQGDNILIDYSGSGNNISIKQSSSEDVYSEEKGAIIKLDEGNITIGTNVDEVTYAEELNITYHHNGIIAENANVTIYNGSIGKITGASSGARSIGSAKSISIVPRSGYTVSGDIETDSTTNKQYVTGEIKYTASN